MLLLDLDLLLIYESWYTKTIGGIMIPEDPNSPAESSMGNSKEESCSTGWSNQRETVDEELPLTFSGTVMVKKISRKAKKIWRKC